MSPSPSSSTASLQVQLVSQSVGIWSPDSPDVRDADRHQIVILLDTGQPEKTDNDVSDLINIDGSTTVGVLNKSNPVKYGS